MIFILNDGNSISLFWKIGKKIYEDKEKYDNVVLKYADYLSYYYGNSHFYTRENIRFMKLFYLSFPIFNIKLEKISWEQYKLLLKIDNERERYFYFYLSLLFNSDFEETKSFIKNNYYKRI